MPFSEKPDGVIPDRWYWVRTMNEPEEWFPAVWDEFSGWSNRDCWEDWDHDVVEWKLIPEPEELR